VTLETAIEEPMTRGGRKKDRDGAVRRCIATGESGATNQLVRFVLSPDGHAVPDLAGRLPGRGAWLTADRGLVGLAVKKRLFSRAFRRPVEVDPDLADRLEALLARRLVETISLARRGGAAVTGAQKVRDCLKSGHAGVLLQASDGARDGRAKLAALAKATGGGKIRTINLLNATELGLAFGREFAIHAALDAGGFAERACAVATRLSGLRILPRPDGNTGEEPRPLRTATDPAAENIDDEVGPVTGAREQDDP